MTSGKEEPPKITRQTVLLGDFREEALKLEETFGTTDRYSTGMASLDEYLFGGFGKQDGYEIVLIYGDTGIGKSTVGLNLLAHSMMNGTKVGLAILENSLEETSVTLRHILGQYEWEKMNKLETVLCLPPVALENLWTLPMLIDYFKYWFEEGVEVIFFDHVQFAFENADLNRGENEYTAQRIFMRQLAVLVKKYKTTVIIISHINKNTASKGLQKVQGSGGIAGSATKVLELHKDRDAYAPLTLRLQKQRGTPGRYEEFMFYMTDDLKMRDLDPKEMPGASEKLF